MIFKESSWSQATNETFILDKNFNTMPAPHDCHTKHSWQQVGFIYLKGLTINQVYFITRLAHCGISWKRSLPKVGMIFLTYFRDRLLSRNQWNQKQRVNRWNSKLWKVSKSSVILLRCYFHLFFIFTPLQFWTISGLKWLVFWYRVDTWMSKKWKVPFTT